jgi:uncharacterized membrane protein
VTSLERTISTALRVGVLLSAAVAGLGGVAYLAVHGGESTQLAAPPDGMRSIVGILRGLHAFDSERVIALGILLLIATPVVRVALLVFAFARQRDVVYVALSALVLMVLLVSLV